MTWTCTLVKENKKYLSHEKRALGSPRKRWGNIISDPKDIRVVYGDEKWTAGSGLCPMTGFVGSETLCYTAKEREYNRYL
jgi:hypothetical protein